MYTGKIKVIFPEIKRKWREHCKKNGKIKTRFPREIYTHFSSHAWFTHNSLHELCLWVLLSVRFWYFDLLTVFIFKTKKNKQSTMKLKVQINSDKQVTYSWWYEVAETLNAPEDTHFYYLLFLAWFEMSAIRKELWVILRTSFSLTLYLILVTSIWKKAIMIWFVYN